jgi:hypothetical protein
MPIRSISSAVFRVSLPPSRQLLIFCSIDVCHGSRKKRRTDGDWIPSRMRLVDEDRGVVGLGAAEAQQRAGPLLLVPVVDQLLLLRGVS